MMVAANEAVFVNSLRSLFCIIIALANVLPNRSVPKIDVIPVGWEAVADHLSAPPAPKASAEHTQDA